MRVCVIKQQPSLSIGMHLLSFRRDWLAGRSAGQGIHAKVAGSGKAGARQPAERRARPGAAAEPS